ncbi:MAG: nuclear transport factor 2 family protein [Myxococcota bacterium]
MEILQRMAAYAADFEKTYLDDDWTRLEPYFHEDAVYEVRGDVAWACTLRGRDAIFRGIKRSLDGFDRRFASRELEPDAPPVVEGNRVSFGGTATYLKDDLPPLHLRLSEILEFDGDRISKLIDVYDERALPAIEWLEAHGEGFDPAYVDPGSDGAD